MTDESAKPCTITIYDHIGGGWFNCDIEGPLKVDGPPTTEAIRNALGPFAWPATVGCFVGNRTL